MKRDELGLYPTSAEDLWLVEVYGVVGYVRLILERIERMKEVCPGCGAATGLMAPCAEDCAVVLAWMEEEGGCDCCEKRTARKYLRAGWDAEGGSGFQACPDCVERIDREYPGEQTWEA